MFANICNWAFTCYCWNHITITLQLNGISLSLQLTQKKYKFYGEASGEKEFMVYYQLKTQQLHMMRVLRDELQGFLGTKVFVPLNHLIAYIVEGPIPN